MDLTNMALWGLQMNSTVPMMNLNSSTPLEVDNIGYKRYHGYVSGFICLLGLIGNLFCIIVWTRRCLRSSAVNNILTGLAFSDLLSVSSYMIYAVYLYIATKPSQFGHHTKSGMYTVLACFYIFVVSSSWSGWLTVTLAVFRYLKVCRNNTSARYCSRRRAKLTILLLFLFMIIVSIPYYFYFEVERLPAEVSGPADYWIRRTYFAASNKDTYGAALHCGYGTVMRVVPCILMLAFSVILICALKKAEYRRQRNLQVNQSGYSRTTVMLVIILFIYVITTLPIGIGSLVVGLSHSHENLFFLMDYSSIGDLLNLGLVVNSSINFAVYFIMSRQFRTTFLELFRCASDDDESRTRLLPTTRNEMSQSRLPTYNSIS